MHDDINPAAEAAIELQSCLQREKFPFCFIGGLAVNRWGEPRYTQDADATVLTEFVHDERLVDCRLLYFPGRRPDVRDFALRARVLLLFASNGNTLDVGQIFESLQPLADLKEDREIVPRLEALMRKRGVDPGGTK